MGDVMNRTLLLAETALVCSLMSGVPGTAKAGAILLADERFLSVTANAGAPYSTGWWVYGETSTTASPPASFAPWSEWIEAVDWEGDGNDSEWLGEGHGEAWAWQNSTIEPTHFEARIGVDLLLLGYKEAVGGGDALSLFRVQFELAETHDYRCEIHQSGRGPFASVLLMDDAGLRILERTDRSWTTTGTLAPGIYTLEAVATASAEAGPFEEFGIGNEASLSFDLAVSAVPDSGSPIALLAGGVAWLAAFTRRFLKPTSVADCGDET